MDVIDNYLDGVFAAYPATTQVLEAKAELRAMMEDVYGGALAAGRSHNEAIGQALSEFGQIDEVAALLALPQSSVTGPSDPAGPSTGKNAAAMPPTAYAFPMGADPERAGSTPPINTQVPTAIPATPETNSRANWGTFQDPFPGVDPYSANPAFVGQTMRRPAISMAQARNFAEVYRRTRWLLAAAIAIFVVAPIPLVSLNVGASDPDFFVSTALATVIGFAVALPLVAVGVGMLVWRHQKLQPFTLIRQGTGQPTPEVQDYAISLQRANARTRTTALIVAIGLWIVAAFPLIGAGVFTEGMPQFRADKYIAVAVAVTLFLVAMGLLVFLPPNWANAVAQSLSDEGLAEARQEHAGPEADSRPTWARVFLSAYWLVVVAIYLGWSLGFDSWDRSWIIFPVAGAVFAAVAAGIGATYGNHGANRD